MGLMLELAPTGSPKGELFEIPVDTVDEALDIVSRREIALTARIVRDGRTLARLEPYGGSKTRFWRVE